MIRNSSAELVQSPPSEWTRIFDSSQVSGYGEYGKDSNYNLFVSALKYAARAAPKAEFILLAGDWLAHGFSDTYYQYAGSRDPRGLHEFIDKTITFLTQRIREQFPRHPDLPGFGQRRLLLRGLPASTQRRVFASDSRHLEGTASQR